MPKTLTKRDIAAELRRRRQAERWTAFRVSPCLYLHPRSPTAAQWVARVTIAGRVRPVHIGPFDLFTLEEARDEANALRKAALQGADPIAERHAAREAEAARATFGAFADTLIDDVTKTMRNAKHREQWRSTVMTHGAPLMRTPIDEIDTDAILRVLKPIWTKTPETASRLRGRLERILDAARARGLRDGENPARWRGHLDTLLPRPPKLSRGHHAAMRWRDLPAFYARLADQDAVSALMLRFLICTVGRAGEVRGARWEEIDLNQKAWTVPATRMKAGKPHRVPLTDEACAILNSVKGLHPDLVFPSQRGTICSDMIFAKLLQRMKVEGATAHGFRSSFRDWTNEAAGAEWHVAEACLAHAVGGAVERAYARSDLFELRRELLTRWGQFLIAGVS